MEFVYPSHSDQSHIDINDPDELRVWSRHHGVPSMVIVDAMRKIGNAVPTARKKLDLPEPA
jgi:hypothetical protein